jgi:hypothetical protein
MAPELVGGLIPCANPIHDPGNKGMQALCLQERGRRSDR